jgi:hypothetical protein
MKSKLFSILFLASFFLTLSTPQAEANVLVFDGANVIQNTSTAISTVGEFGLSLATKLANALGSQVVLINKALALFAVQKSTALLVGGDSGSGSLIRDFGDYLFTAPQQKALSQMSVFFSSASSGRISSLNYEGVGSNYDRYLASQARQKINGYAFVTNIQSQVTDPRGNLFSTGNMSGFMTFLQPANNPMSYTLTAEQHYNNAVARAQEIAKSENVNGFVPTKVNGRITNPASIAENALLEVDKLGTSMIMEAHGSTPEDKIAAVTQIWEGAGISAAARLTKYGIVDPVKKAIAKELESFPFSLSYGTNDHTLGISTKDNTAGYNITNGTGYIKTP